ncbi:Dihydropyrimidinase [Diplonema papillatum]|nr:Dihydropyrimidinase [Diplonema papillatum]
MAILVKGGTIVNDDDEFVGDVLIEGDKIKQVAASIPAPAGATVVDATGRYVLPGGIDTHTHMQLPFMGTKAVDDFNHGTRAAVAGGTTMLLDFVVPSRGVSLLKAYDEWRGWADPKVNCDYSFHVAITYWDEDVSREMGVLVNERGVNSFKVFMAYKNVFMLRDDEIYAVFARCKELGALAQVHAENGDVIDIQSRRLLKMGITGPEGHMQCRPADVEGEATWRAIMLADQVNTPVYIVHVMSKEAADMVAKGKKEGKLCYGEPIAAGLGTDGTNCWNEDWRHASGYVMGPPLRPDPTVKEYLMKCLSVGLLSCVGTDNCTFNADQKAMGKDDFTKIPNGVNGIEDRMSVVWEKGVKAGVLTRKQFVSATSAAGAKIFNIYPQKGRIAAGSDADLVVWNDVPRTISKATHHHAVDFNIFEGMVVHGVADVTISRGKIVWQDGELRTKNGDGKYVPRRPFGCVFDSVAVREEARRAKKIKREPYTGPVFVPKK